MFLLQDHLSRSGHKTLFHTECEGCRMQGFSPFMRPFIYAFGHFLLVVVGATFSYILWHNKSLNKLVLAFLYLTGVHNGAKLYSDRYSHVPIAKLHKVISAPDLRTHLLDKSLPKCSKSVD